MKNNLIRKNESLSEEALFYAKKFKEAIEAAEVKDKKNQEAEEKSAKVKLGVAFNLFYENPVYYTLLGNSNALMHRDSTWYRHFGGMISVVLTYKVVDKLGITLTVPVGTISSVINLGNKTSPFGVGLSWELNKIQIICTANFSQSLRVKKADMDKQQFPRSTYPSLSVGAKIPDDILKNHAVNGLSIFPSVGAVFPLAIFKQLK
jgi:hypothetical protein